MRTSQWFILGFAFLLLTTSFISKDYSYEAACGGYMGRPEYRDRPLLRPELWCINTEILDPFIYLFAVMWVVCWINGGLEWWAERKTSL